MFCDKCGCSLPQNVRFCPQCGNDVAGTVLTSQTANNNFDNNYINNNVQNFNIGANPPKKKKRTWKIVLFIVVGLILVGVIAQLLNVFVINSASKLTNKLENTTWYTEPLCSVAVNTGDNILTAYSITFHSDGTATIHTYMHSCPYYQDPEYSDMEIVKTRTVNWKIDSNRKMTLDGKEYKYNAKIDRDNFESDVWYLENDRVKVGRTYYKTDTWGYSR